MGAVCWLGAWAVARSSVVATALCGAIARACECALVRNITTKPSTHATHTTTSTKSPYSYNTRSATQARKSKTPLQLHILQNTATASAARQPLAQGYNNAKQQIEQRRIAIAIATTCVAMMAIARRLAGSRHYVQRTRTPLLLRPACVSRCSL
eukprot:scaffold2315_cov145-Isochrysis_galbana.AAC.7